MGLGVLMGGAAILGIAGQGFSAYQQYKNNKYNAEAARFDAAQSKRAAGKEAGLLVEDEAREIGRVRAIAGASGIAADEGSNMDVMDDIRSAYAADIAAVRIAGELGVYQGERSAKMSESRAAQSITAGALNIGTTALTYALSRPGASYQRPSMAGSSGSSSTYGANPNTMARMN